MMTRLTFVALSAALVAASAHASSTSKSSPKAEGDCAVNYALFEFSTPHVDLETCPVSIGAGEGHFCRATLSNDMLHVYVFEEGGFQCLEKMQSYESREFDIQIH